MYVGAAGMMFEGLLRAGRKRLTGDFIVASAAIALYLLTRGRAETKLDPALA